MKKFLCYDTNDAASGKINVDNRGMLKPNSTVPSTNGTPYQQLVTDGDGNTKWEDRLAYVTDPVKTELVPEETVRLTLQPDGRYAGSLPVPVILSEGATYFIKIDGVEYESVCKVKSDWGKAYIGNLALTGTKEEVEDTGEPYCYTGPVSGPAGGYWFFSTVGEQPIISLTGVIGTVVPLDKKFATSIVRVVDFPENWTEEEIQEYFNAFSTGTVLICGGAGGMQACIVLALYRSGISMKASLISEGKIVEVTCGEIHGGDPV